jgi:hypothetical protein
MFTIKGGGLKEELERRIAALQSQQVGFVIWVPDNMSWWYYHEFGTLGGYPIDPVNAKFLSWPEPQAQGGRRYAAHVTHPGNKPLHMVYRITLDAQEYTREAVMQAFQESGYDPEQLQFVMLNDVGPAVQQMIVDSIAEQLPGVRQDGKLMGESAAEAFAAESEIHPLT